MMYWEVLLTLLVGGVVASGAPAGKIVGGEEVDPHSVPFQLSLQTIQGSHFCGATLLDETHALSVAHCCLMISADLMQVVGGEHDLSLEEGVEVRRKVKRVLPHGQFDYNYMNNDICILELEKPMPMSGRIKKVSLPTSDTDLFTGQSGKVIGWGLTCASCGPSPVLLQTSLKIISNEACKESYPYENIDSSMICARGQATDSCKGDSGGPLLCDRGVQCGIVSWGYSCGHSTFPGVYTRVSVFLDWIQRNSL